MKLNFDWWRWLVTISFGMLAISLLCRCTTTRYVPMVEYKDKILVKTDTLIRSDSVWIHDSTVVTIKGDTKFIDRWHDKYRDIYVYRNRTDTLLLHDSIPYKVEVEKPMSIKDKVATYMECIAIVALLIVITALSVYLNNKFFKRK